jgi:hypothetical protein
VKKFLDSYGIEDVNLKASSQYLEIISQRTSIYDKGRCTTKGKLLVQFHINHLSYIVDTFIPLLSDFSFASKKYKDFLD